MDRVELSREKYRKLFGDFPDNSENPDQEFMAEVNEILKQTGAEVSTHYAASVAENQLKAHITANEKVGNSKKMLIDAITQCILYIGFPRTLNALSCINEMMKES